MGGIIGKLSFDHDETLARPVIEQMLDALRHRGSTRRGIYVAPGIALGWCGDDSTPISGSEVATDTTGRVHVVADAALTNASELGRELRKCGHRVNALTDAALIAEAYAEWGDGCIDRLDGPFACAIWDGSTERLLFARDGLGIRPLFFAVLHGHGIVFASEIRALLQDPGVGREWCPRAIDAYLALGYVPAPLTPYQRISKLESGQRVIVDGRRLHVEQFWDLPQPADHPDVDSADALAAALRRSIGRDSFPTSLMLYSGGSSSTALLCALHPGSQTGLTVETNREPAESERSQLAGRHLGFDVTVAATPLDAATLARRLAAHFDEPLADPAAITQFWVLSTARQFGDRAVAAHGASALWNAGGHADRVPTDLWDTAGRHAIYTRGFAWEVRDANPWAQVQELRASRKTDPIDRDRYVAARTILPDSQLAIAERASLAAGLSLRLPFLDRELVELAARYPNGLEAHPSGRQPLDVMVARMLPPSLRPPASLTRPRYPWLSPALASLIPHVLLGPRFDGRGVVSRPALQRLWDDHSAGRRDHSHRLWSLLMLEFWFREFLDGDAGADEAFEYAIVRAA